MRFSTLAYWPYNRFRLVSRRLDRVNPVKLQKKHFGVKNRPLFRGFFEATDLKFIVQVPKIWLLVHFDVPHKMVSRFCLRNRVNPEKNPKNSWKTRTTRVFCHFWAREAFNHSENSIIVFSAIFPFRQVSAWHTFLKLIFFTPQAFSKNFS